MTDERHCPDRPSNEEKIECRQGGMGLLPLLQVCAPPVMGPNVEGEWRWRRMWALRWTVGGCGYRAGALQDYDARKLVGSRIRA